jgi:hypothetical protein
MPPNNIQNDQTGVLPEVQDRSSLSGRRSAREILLLCTTASIPPGRKERISRILAGEVDWKYLLKLAEFHGIAPLISNNLTTNGFESRIPQPYLERLGQIYSSTLYKNIIIEKELTKALTTLNRHGLVTIALKGTILSEQLYGNPALRTVVDTDILVRPVELSLAGSLLREIGYQKLASKKVRNHPFHEVYCKPGQFPSYIDLHWNLADMRLVNFPLSEIWQRGRSIQVQASSATVLSPEDTILYLSNNLSKQDNQLLKSLCDISELLKKYGDDLDWSYIVKSAFSWKIEIAVYYSLRRSKELLRAPVPEFALKALKPGVWRRWLLNVIARQDIFLTITRPPKLRAEIFNLVQALMMDRPLQMLTVLVKHQDDKKTVKWLRIALWIIVAFWAVLGINIVVEVSGWMRRASMVKNWIA